MWLAGSLHTASSFNCWNKAVRDRTEKVNPMMEMCKKSDADEEERMQKEEAVMYIT